MIGLGRPRPTPHWARSRWVRAALGLGLAAVMLVAYYAAVRPARVWLAEDVAGPILASLDTPRARSFQLQQPPGRRSVVWAVPRDATPATVEARRAQWAAPLGALFLMPALFLVAVFPLRLYWALLLGYHAALGVAAFLAFYVGMGWFAPAFGLYTFSQTYVAETISLVIPLLLFLAGRRTGEAGPRTTDDGPQAEPA